MSSIQRFRSRFLTIPVRKVELQTNIDQKITKMLLKLKNSVFMCGAFLCGIEMLQSFIDEFIDELINEKKSIDDGHQWSLVIAVHSW